MWLGFAGAAETAYGAEMVGIAHREIIDIEPKCRPLISSACPVIVNLIEKYYPDLIPHLAPIVSPMIAHARSLRAKYGEDAFVVFIGPCIAKKGEILEDSVAGAVDAALTFEELQEWMDEMHVPVPPPQAASEARAQTDARLFPVEGGLVKTANMNTDMLARDVVTTSGLEACQDVLRSIRAGKLDASLVELMACEGGCINGPAMNESGSVYLARQRVMDYASHRAPFVLPARENWPRLDRCYADKSTPVPEFTEEQIQQVLQRVDKYTPEDELNCGACGYPTCRDKAIAVLRGMAEATMCIPYMRRCAESLCQKVIDVTPNAIIVVDMRLHIQDMSPSAEKLLNQRLADVKEQPLQNVLSVVDSFVRVRDSGQPVLGETVRLRDDLSVEQIIVPVEGQSLLVGILRDITERQRQDEQLDRIRTETLARTREVVNEQMRAAHQIAQLLGESTAQTKMMVTRLAHLLEEGSVK